MMVCDFALEAFETAFSYLNAGKNLFVTGSAGTGKTTFLRELFRKSSKKSVVVAPTGVAALQVGGQTIHSFFRFPPTFVDCSLLKPYRSRLLKELELLIVDEVSMVRADLFQAMDLRLREVKGKDRPFGGVQVCLVGDLFQLPPVVFSSEISLFEEHYASPYFFSTPAYLEGGFSCIEFQTIYRQKDPRFIQLLQKVREGTCSLREVSWLNERVLTEEKTKDGVIVLTATNASADEINQTCLKKLSTKSETYDGLLKGQFMGDKNRLPAPQSLTLKEGAQVMFVKNDLEQRWVNGTLGVVEKLSQKAVFVRVGAELYSVEPEKWQSIVYAFDEQKNKVVEKTLGTYTQFPLVPAWAMTIHKSQGKTLDQVAIDLGRGAFAPGQLYVALSRCRHFETVFLMRPITLRDIRCDPRVISFMAEL